MPVRGLISDTGSWWQVPALTVLRQTQVAGCWKQGWHLPPVAKLHAVLDQVLEGLFVRAATTF